MKIVVIGGGPGGYEAAIYAAKCGAQTVLVEKNRLGGTCLNVGCIPTKALLASGEALATVKNAAAYGLHPCAGAGADFAAVMQRKDKAVSALVAGVAHLLEKNGVRHIRGTARLLGGNRIRVAHMAGDAYMDVEADAILLATGSEPALPGFLPAGEPRIITSDEALSLSAPPASLTVVGGGVIGCEIGQILARMGTRVTIVELLQHLLPGEDADVAAVLARQMKKDGIKTVTGCGIQQVTAGCEGVCARLADGREVVSDMLLAAVGRRPYTRGLGLETVGIITDKQGCIPVDSCYKTSAPGIYAIGDVLNTPQLAHVAAKEGVAAVDAILGRQRSVDYKAVPRCVYTQPEVAGVGATQHQLEGMGVPHRVGRFDYIANGKAKASGKTDGFAKVLTDEGGVLMGAAIVGERATDMLSILTTGIHQKMTARQLGDIMFPHPTLSEIVMEALHDVYGMSIHKG